MTEYNIMSIEDKRDFSEETYLNASEFNLLKHIAGKYGVSRAAAQRICIHIVGDKIIRDEAMNSTGNLPEL